ncbi:MAG: 5-methylcytosine-specific restriction endonuclease McrA [Rhodothermales bacterium]|jgi:5-methylcytosine-specific restriction endonuclease McrA
MTGHVLVLNQDYRALTICSVQRATILVFLQKAELVSAETGRYIRSKTQAFPWPSVVRLRAYVSIPYKRISLTRKNVMCRDGNRCQYCGDRTRLTIDHVVPRSRGGKDSWENLVTACVPCNNKKGSRTLEQAGLELRKKPFRPSHVMFIRDFVGTLGDDWKPYLFMA